jgi:lipopolysaccharide/colanic/teichoic acid biosynthesis glycosyltransferase
MSPMDQQSRTRRPATPPALPPGPPVHRTGPGVLLGGADGVRLAAAEPRAEAFATVETGGNELACADLDWSGLAPRGIYAAGGQRALCLALVLAAAPLALALGALVALANLVYFRDPRRVFFVQERVGRAGARFRIFKFRTMSEPKRSTFEAWSGNDAARVTPLGRFLRNTHLDELPQLWNVLRGDMSLFGPRPEMVEVDAWARAHVPSFPLRLAVKPGLTGLSQVTQGYTGRDIEAYRGKLAGDLAYIARFGPAQDLGLLLRTVAWVVRGRGWNWRPKRPSAQAPGE